MENKKAIRVIKIDNGSADEAEVKAHPRLRLELRRNDYGQLRWFNATYPSEGWVDSHDIQTVAEAMDFANAAWGRGWNLTIGSK